MSDGKEQESQQEPTHRAYQCPRCGGEFDEWREIIHATSPDECPFCGVKKGRCDPDR